MPTTPNLALPYPASSAPANVPSDIQALATKIDIGHLKVIKEAPLNIQYPEYGALGDDGTDDTAAITAAVSALGPNGGELFAPPGSYRCDSGIDAADSRSVTIVGVGGLSGGARTASRFRYTGAAARFIDARSAVGFRMRDAQVTYDNASFVGHLVDFQHSAAAGDGAYGGLERCFLGGLSVRSAGSLLNLDKAIAMRSTDCVFAGADVAVKGKATSGSYSNAINFANCLFVSSVTNHVRNSGQAWTFDSCTFENLVTSGGVVAGAGAYGADYAAKALTFNGCWMGDAVIGSGNWIDAFGDGIVVHGCYIGNGQAGIRLDGGDANGVSIKGNVFDTNTYGVIVNTGGADAHDDLDIAPNVFLTHSAANRILWGNVGQAAPTTGAHGVGEFRPNRAPTELGTAGSKYVITGWTCTTAGTPGTWLQCRALTGN